MCAPSADELWDQIDREDPRAGAATWALAPARDDDRAHPAVL